MSLTTNTSSIDRWLRRHRLKTLSYTRQFSRLRRTSKITRSNSVQTTSRLENQMRFQLSTTKAIYWDSRYVNASLINIHNDVLHDFVISYCNTKVWILNKLMKLLVMHGELFLLIALLVFVERNRCGCGSPARWGQCVAWATLGTTRWRTKLANFLHSDLLRADWKFNHSI